MASAARVFRNGCCTLMAAAKTNVASSSATARAAKPPSARAAKPPSARAAKPPSARANVFSTPTVVSPSLSKFLGASEASRTEAVKKVWDYAKSHNLQNPDNKREIFCDDTLKSIFEGREKVGFGDIAKLISKHFPKAAA